MGLNLVIAILTTWCTSFSLKYSFDSSPVWISTVTVPTYRWSWATASSPLSMASSSAPSSCPTRASTTAWPPRTASSAPSPRSACECWARPWWACWRTNNSLRGRGPAHCTPRSCWRRSARRRAWPCSSTAKRGRSSRTCSRGSRSNSLRRPGRSGGTWPNWNPCWTGGRAATAAITSQRCDTWLLLQRLTHAFLRFYSSFSSQTAELRCGRTVKKKKKQNNEEVGAGRVQPYLYFLAWGTATRWLWHTLTHTHRHPRVRSSQTEVAPATPLINCGLSWKTYREMRRYCTEGVRGGRGKWTGQDINSQIEEKKKVIWNHDGEKEEIEKGTQRETDACLTLGALWKYYPSVLLESSHISVLTLN